MVRESRPNTPPDGTLMGIEKNKKLTLGAPPAGYMAGPFSAPLVKHSQRGVIPMAYKKHLHLCHRYNQKSDNLCAIKKRTINVSLTRILKDIDIWTL
ncbi:hypothetical protein SAMN05660836_00809 [Thermodesulforhabdus norvegica]|uniref:Uncharacterized protein n=1 Tax=Thermodesulforhabdus norvegica TaxID=39841 RepID=A0A1I4S7S4_9BACT|nr:hypothetical protein SAMN05660836_00809 [Thermodesulforhabdus norvegica]